MSTYKEFTRNILDAVKGGLILFQEEKISRIAVVYDFGSLDFYPLYLAVLTSELEKEYRLKIRSDSDYQLLWNPEEFSEYATPRLTVNFDKPCEIFLTKELDDADYSLKIRKAICEACHSFNNEAGRDVFLYCVDPELADLRENIDLIGNIPPKYSVEIPSWA